MKYPNAAKGIKRIYIAEILSISAIVLSIGIRVILAVGKVEMSNRTEEITQALRDANILAPFAIFGIGMMVLLLLSYFFNLAGILKASKDEAGFKRALWVLLAGIAIDFIVSILQNSNDPLADWLKIPSTLCTMVVTLFVLQGIGRLAENLGKREISDMSARCRTFLISALILSVFAKVFVALQAAESTMKTTSGITSYLLEIIAYVFYIRVLKKARSMQ